MGILPLIPSFCTAADYLKIASTAERFHSLIVVVCSLAFSFALACLCSPTSSAGMQGHLLDQDGFMRILWRQQIVRLYPVVLLPVMVRLPVLLRSWHEVRPNLLRPAAPLILPQAVMCYAPYLPLMATDYFASKVGSLGRSAVPLLEPRREVFHTAAGGRRPPTKPQDAGVPLHCEDYPPRQEPAPCRNAHSTAVTWQSAYSFVNNVLLTCDGRAAPIPMALGTDAILSL